MHIEFNPFKPTGRYINHLLKPPYLLNHNRKWFQQHFVINILGLMNNFQSINHDFVHCFFPGGCRKVPRFSKSKNIQVASSKKHISNSKIIKNAIFSCSSLLKILFLPRNITCQRFYIIFVQFMGNYISDVDISTTRKSQ